jgi:hypothetical protein
LSKRPEDVGAVSDDEAAPSWNLILGEAPKIPILDAAPEDLELNTIILPQPFHDELFGPKQVHESANSETQDGDFSQQSAADTALSPSHSPNKSGAYKFDEHRKALSSAYTPAFSVRWKRFCRRLRSRPVRPVRSLKVLKLKRHASTRFRPDAIRVLRVPWIVSWFRNKKSFKINDKSFHVQPKPIRFMVTCNTLPDQTPGGTDLMLQVSRSNPNRIKAIQFRER